MKTGAAVLVLVGAAVALYLNYGMTLKFLMLAMIPGPDHAFDITHASMVPDYRSRSSWLAHPESSDNADWKPREDQTITSDSTPGYVFFIHPTAYLDNEHWNGTLQKNTATDENRQWMRPPDSPFILATDSQGTVHGQRLLQEVIDGSAVRERLVAAYLVGGTIHEELFYKHYRTVGICESITDLYCVNAWDSWRTGINPDNSVPNWSGDRYVRNSNRWLCVNPLSWQHDEQEVLSAENPGSMPLKNAFNIYSLGGDVPVGGTWGPLGTPISGLASAQCIDGVLRTNDMDEGPLAGHSWGGNYHSLDYSLYYQGIRNNVQIRLDNWWQQKNSRG